MNLAARAVFARVGSPVAAGKHLSGKRIAALASMASMEIGNGKLQLDEFSFRQFDDPAYGGTKIPIGKEEFMDAVLKHYEERLGVEKEFKDRPVLVDGYAPFCKHIFMPNFCDGLLEGEVAITEGNRHLLRSGYSARKEGELPVLSRFFPKEKVTLPRAKYLDLILYSREQIIKEGEATGNPKPNLHSAPWRLIAVKGQSVPYEIPMSPITMMRNELISQGGSGVPINKEAYLQSVKYWKDHAIVQ